MNAMRAQVMTLLLLLLLVVGLPRAASGWSATLQKVTVLTRNGARGLSSLSDGKMNCDNCKLSAVGRDMSFHLGVFLRSRYSDALGLGKRLNTTLVSFRAAQAARTIATGQGVTLGMFPGALPLVRYRPARDDVLLAATQSWPSWLLQDLWRGKAHLDDAWASERLTLKDRKALSRFLPPSNAGLCERSPALCALYVYDSWGVNASAGHEDAALRPLLPALQTVTRRILWRLYGADPRDPDNRGMGPLAGPLLREVLSGPFSSYSDDGSSSTSSTRLAVYVGPMPVVFAVLSGLGLFDAVNTLAGDSSPVPQFGDAIAFEHTTAGGEHYVQVYQFTWASGGTNASGYTGKRLEVSCMDSEGNTYASSAAPHGCTVADMRRYLDSLGAAEGQCFATGAALVAAGCGGKDAPPAGSLCHMYRDKCPAAPCGGVPGTIADPSRGFACQDAGLNKGTSYLAAAIVALGAPCVLAGSIFGLYFPGHIWR
ncbi:putative membrane-bound acid phosphatase 2 [Trypanosoma rangeli]|uniref:Putative membrane-bound acid phosphatase 2 n=1 Tax=Trypanosoma rangeli TaxID=5698 RepID=A0A3R7KGH3_TRYRA|nr:putative membrane-bound acid phosphatase 2 [Trypanosoma rangeli]RNF06034.1 putative membrane-bound acid phosphatase 2 [Trypanosoma rangeli]|eukprot:RNF06034.1 putative membrane-bound acid phosphatase 2 [Trypanosoma rangeli]